MCIRLDLTHPGAAVARRMGGRQHSASGRRAEVSGASALLSELCSAVRICMCICMHCSPISALLISWLISWPISLPISAHLMAHLCSCRCNSPTRLYLRLSRPLTISPSISAIVISEALLLCAHYPTHVPHMSYLPLALHCNASLHQSGGIICGGSLTMMHDDHLWLAG